jgi:putative glutamine amidotransferase
LSERRVVAITQRVVDLPDRNERRDVLDQAWAPFLEACGLDMLAVPNRLQDPVEYVARFGASAVILSGGNNISASLGTLSGSAPRLPACDRDLAPERDRTETALLHASVARGWPVIGVCRGLQVLNIFHGGGLAAAPGHAGTRHALVPQGGTKFDTEVNSYHDFGVPREERARDLNVLATADDWAEALEHDQLRHLGIMWHPERNRPLSANDIALFSTYLRGRSS